MAVTDKQVEQAQERVERLRAELAEEKAGLESDESSRENEYRKALLANEEDRLKMELAAVKAQRKAAPAIIDQAIEQVALGESPTVTVDEPTVKENS